MIVIATTVRLEALHGHRGTSRTISRDVAADPSAGVDGMPPAPRRGAAGIHARSYCRRLCRVYSIGSVGQGGPGLRHAARAVQHSARPLRSLRGHAAQHGGTSAPVCPELAEAFSIQRLDRRYADGQWKEILVEDHRAGPAEVAAARIDIVNWFDSLPVRKRRIAQALGVWACDQKTWPRSTECRASRISQLRQELR